MQDITRTKCNSIAEETEGRLIDTRDNKVYWVAKLKDGLCWMTQNLDYDGGGTKVTNLNGHFTSSDTTGKYYDPGKIVYLGTSAVDVTDMSASDDPNYNAIIGNNTYNAHYLVGNYYNWMAATNGTGASVTTNGANASGSVCPTGWSLPTSGNTNTGSFGGLTTAYSIGDNAAGSTALRSAPLYFVYGGNVSNSSLSSIGSLGYYWSSTASSATSAYGLYFSSSGVNPSNGPFRYLGGSVRCVAR